MTHDTSARIAERRGKKPKISAYYCEPGTWDEETKKRPEMLKLYGLTNGMSVSPSFGSPFLKASFFVSFTLDIVVIEFGIFFFRNVTQRLVKREWRSQILILPIAYTETSKKL